MEFLESKGSEQIRKIYTNHGASSNMFGVKVGDMKVVQKKVKINHSLAMELYATNNSDAQYLAGLIANPGKFTEADFNSWAENATWYMVSEYALAWNLAESPLCMEICKKWIDSDNPRFQEAGWAALSSHVGITPDDILDLDYFETLIDRIVKKIHTAPNRVRYTMNGFLIALGGSVASLTEKCIDAGRKIGKVEVYMGNTSCQVPVIEPYLRNMEARGRIGKRKKSAKC